MYIKIPKVFVFGNIAQPTIVTIVYPKIYVVVINENNHIYHTVHRIGRNLGCRRPKTIINRLKSLGYKELENSVQ